MRENISNTRLEPLHDGYGRTVNYLRLSVTDRCNLRCIYCAPLVDGLEYIPHASILSYEEFMRLIRVAVRFGVQKVRLTGGEPFARLGFTEFVTDIHREFPDLTIGITTNATLLHKHIPDLAAAGIKTLNISLDTLNPELFERITGKNSFAEVYAAIQEAMAAGIKVKINAVALRGLNDAELPALLDFAANHPVDLRMIEYMPMGGRGHWGSENFWPAHEILEAAQACRELEPWQPSHEEERLSGPAKIYAIKGGLGRFGIITPVSQHFCGTCNRLRVTAEGRLRTCLFSDREYDLRAMLRNEKVSDESLYRLFVAATDKKPLGTELLQHRSNREKVITRFMSSIGG